MDRETLEANSKVHVHGKGAAELILSSCTRWVDIDGSICAMDLDKMNEFKKSIEDMAAISLRCVAFAYRICDLDEVPGKDKMDNWQLPDNELILLAIVGIKTIHSKNSTIAQHAIKH
ncbi:calcium-transporting ATPase 9, plasma membrane-type-like isoform X3 [Canna indica]|uniref:Calcium-transporting ATPase 9, plasma membrane-type-like isoform X3 n=1 Tax=Canna indica TaxID=4628 RepID=A0AAQ3K8Q4_9LILI|nr:calcium-transporting ATPase 9, plasma membrane-type-like isoform X3 [Canna indica]